MSVRVAINGFGRIGRNILRAAVEAGRKDFEVLAINDLAPVETNAHLLRYDSVHGRFPGEVTVKGDSINCGNGAIKVTAVRDPAQLPWKELGVDIALECTGIFTARDKAAAHLSAGAKRVLISAPAEGADITVVYGVNHDKLAKAHTVVSNASCTTNCLAPVVKVVHEAIGIRHGQITTIHDPTNTNVVVDAPHRDLRRARSAMLSLSPTTTGSATAIALIYPELQGRLNGHAVRAPVLNASLTDCVFELEHAASAADVNELFRSAAAGSLRGILGFEDRPLVSADYVNDSRSAIVDGPSTMVTDGTLLKVYAWYDNEVGYACRMVDLANIVIERGA
jgi:glyceraldehyde 3-phosphate dehydrogenase